MINQDHFTYPDGLDLLAQAHIFLLQRLIGGHDDDTVAGRRCSSDRRRLAVYLPRDVLDDGGRRGWSWLTDQGGLLTYRSWYRCWSWWWWLVYYLLSTPVC